jgi:two-component system response regulator FixJ
MDRLGPKHETWCLSGDCSERKHDTDGLGSGKSQSTIFVVDPDPATGEQLRRALETPNCVVKCYPSAKAFLQAFGPCETACLVAELQLPGLDGLALLERTCRSGVRIPSIILSVDGSVRDAVNAIRGGAVSFASKPLRKYALVAEIRRILN